MPCGVGRVLSKIAIFAKIDIEGRVSENPGGGGYLIFNRRLKQRKEVRKDEGIRRTLSVQTVS